MWKKFLKDYLTFTKRDRTGILALLISIFLIVLLPKVFPSLKKTPVLKTEVVKNFEQSLNPTKTFKPEQRTAFVPTVHNETEALNSSPETFKPFYFNPNTATIEEWVRLGVKEKTAKTIHKYISKGGKFRKPEDITRIYTLPASTAEKLIPYIVIPEEKKAPFIHAAETTGESPAEIVETTTRETPAPPPVSNNSFRYPKKEYRMVDINLADTTAFQTFPGIASKMSNRIINYRERLGGFVSIDQVAEVWPLPDSVFRKIKPYLTITSYSVRKFNLNTVDIDTLKTHPYLGYTLANTIIQYRNQHGNFKSLEDLRKLHSLNDALIEKLIPYLAVD
ncbi:MAG: helix-hairpin-helix domain-containing protein [Chitinophagaceae bacterium]|nr:helix-hairpin-helix domain-containing protein [Chitinophagaceae bacterium]